MDTSLGPFKRKLKNNLIITCNDDTIANNLELFLRNFLRYKSTGDKYLRTKKSKSFCPVNRLYKCVYNFFYHNFDIHPKLLSNLQKAKAQQQILKEQHGVELEEYELLLFKLFDSIISFRKAEKFKIFLEISEKYPNCLINFRFGLENALLAGKERFCLKLAENHSKYEENFKSVSFLGNKSFILLEVKDYKEGSRLLKLGVQADDKDMWIQHNYSHLYYYINQGRETIEYLENCRKSWKIRDNFIYKHNMWHLAVGYLDCNIFDKANEIEEMLVNFNVNEGECLVNILGYILRSFYRGHYEFIRRKWLIKLSQYFFNENRLMYNYLYDCMSVLCSSFLLNLGKNLEWLRKNDPKGLDDSVINEHISFSQQVKEEELFTRIFNRVNYNASRIDSPKDKSFVENEYQSFMRGMIHLGKLEFSKAFELFKANAKKMRRIGGSVEQRFVMAESVIFASVNCGEYDYAEEVIKQYFALNFDSNFISKSVETINKSRK